MKDGNKLLTKKRQALSTRETLCRLIAFVVVVLTVTIIMQTISSTHSITESNTSVDIREYERLLGRAKELTKQYTELAGKHSLPDGIPAGLRTVDRNAQSKVNMVVTNKENLLSNLASSSSIKTDLILGMAQDTDAKNLVSRTLYDQL